MRKNKLYISAENETLTSRLLIQLTGIFNTIALLLCYAEQSDNAL